MPKKSTIQKLHHSTSPAVLLFPAHGCAAAGSLTKEQVDETLRQLRGTLRQYWEHPGVKAAVELLEIRAAWMVHAAITSPHAGEFGRGEASGATQMATALREAFLSREEGAQ